MLISVLLLVMPSALCAEVSSVVFVAGRSQKKRNDPGFG
jgi:hypothetical protein